MVIQFSLFSLRNFLPSDKYGREVWVPKRMLGELGPSATVIVSINYKINDNLSVILVASAGLYSESIVSL